MKHSKKGSVLIISLIIMSIATSLALFIIKVTKDITVSSKMILDKLEAKIKAESEIEKIKFVFSTGKFKKYYLEPTVSSLKLPSKIYLDGSNFQMDKHTKVSIKDTSSKVNLFFYTDETELKKLFSNIFNLKIVNKLTSTYLDWVDKDNFVRLGGAESEYYRSVLKAKYGTRNNTFLQDIEELLNIDGFTNDIYKELKKHITFIYRGGYINLYLADTKLLHMFKYIDEETIKTIKNLKKTKRLDRLEKFISSKPELSEFLSNEPSKVIEVWVKTSIGEAEEKIYCIIDFKETKNFPFVVYKYKE